LKNFENHSNYNCKITLDNGEQYVVYANWIHNQDLDHWQGYRCSGGNTRFYIDNNFDIWSGVCENDCLGNVLGDWEIKTDTVCHQTTCNGCTDDLITEKHAA
jgi:hypothetical protein